MLAAAGYLSAFLMGFPLALFGSGGSILTVPILVYLFGIPPTLATAYSLLLVGVTSALGVVTYHRNGLVRWAVVALFAPPSMAGAFGARRFLLPAIPERIFEWHGMMVGREFLLMALFGVLMLGAATRMLRGHQADDERASGAPQVGVLVSVGLAVGVLTGLVGAGGGFLIIPALVVFAKVPLKVAAATSLAVITANSSFGLIGDLERMATMDFRFVAAFLAASLTGMLLGSLGAGRIPSARLKPAFGSFLVVMGVFVLWRTLSR